MERKESVHVLFFKLFVSYNMEIVHVIECIGVVIELFFDCVLGFGGGLFLLQLN
eukprot:UN04277